ncbi:MAG: hypothetical protein JJU03_00150 [Idiomarina sp.]|nr:hypothetical protein [Idiomarina sp.]
MKARFAIFLSLLILTACASTAQQPAEEIYQQRQGLQQIWQGYDPVARGVGYYQANDGHVILTLDTTSAPANFSQLSPGVWRSNEPFPHLRQNFYINTPLHDTTATLVRFPRESRSPFITLVHEDFHGYQRDNFANDFVTSTLSRFDTGSLALSTLVAALKVERALLSAALDAKDAAIREQALFQYAGLRLWREAQLPEESVTVERRIETSEGTANWVGYRGEQQLQGYSDNTFTNKLLTDLGIDYENVSGSLSVRLMTARVYSTGAALSEVLTQTTEHQWQVLVEQESATLFNTLLNAFQWPQDALQEAGARIGQSEAFTQAEGRASRISWPDSDDSTLNRIERDHNWKLTFYLPPSSSSAGFTATSGTVTPLNDDIILLNPVSQFDIESDALSLEIRNLTLVYRWGGDKNAENEDLDPVPLIVYLNRIDSSLLCADEQTLCEGRIDSISQSGLTIRSEMPLRYQLERLDQ